APPPPAESTSQPAVLPHAPVLPSEAEFRRLQDTDGSVRGYELDSGRLVPMPPAFEDQSSSWGDVYRRIGNYLEQNPIGKVWLDLATYLDPAGKRRYFPDIVYLANEDLHRLHGKRVNGPPTMICEISGETSWERENVEKRHAYYEAGVPWYWIVDLVHRQTTELRRGDAGYEIVSLTPLDQPFRPALFPGL